MILTEDGGIVYGSVRAGERYGKLNHRSWLGLQTLGTSDDGSFVGFREQGLYMPDGFRGIVSGAALRWNTAVHGLMIGASDLKTQSRAAKVTTRQGVALGSTTIRPYHLPQYFAKYERGRVLAAAEFARVSVVPTTTISGRPPLVFAFDFRNWYTMASYKATPRLTAGLYYSRLVNHVLPPGPAQYSKDWALSGRYDFSQYLYAKAEQHFFNGTAVGYDMDLNLNGLQPKTRLTVLKLGFSF